MNNENLKKDILEFINEYYKLCVKKEMMWVDAGLDGVVIDDKESIENHKDCYGNKPFENFLIKEILNGACYHYGSFLDIKFDYKKKEFIIKNNEKTVFLME